MTVLRYASPIDAGRHGVHHSPRPTAESRPASRFTQRLGRDVPAEAGRYHLYAGHFCPWSHRLSILRQLANLADDVSISYVDGLRDGRGWAFRPATGRDPVNGFALVREAYAATDPGYAGQVSVPVLWDRAESRIVSNEPITLGIDLITAFGSGAGPAAGLYAAADRDRIETFDRWLRPAITYGIARAAVDRVAAEALATAWRRLDTLLEHRTFVLGERLTDADIRLWVSLVRYDCGPNAHGTLGPRLATYPHVWDYARALFGLDAFAATTDFTAFTAPFAVAPDWAAPTDRMSAGESI